MSTDTGGAQTQEHPFLPAHEATEPQTREIRLRGRGKPCDVFSGPRAKYREKAIAVTFAETGTWHRALTWPRPECGTDLCLTFDHLSWSAPQRLEYPGGVCTYCGQLSHTRDHLLPRTWTGEGKIRWNVLTVPACAECNCAIGDKFVPSINERREIAHKSLRRRKARVLGMPDWTPDKLAETSGMLRKFIERGIHDRALIRARLAWPEEPDYDLRIMQLSGIENPYEIGLLTLPEEGAA